jgi:hypothetical protein
MRLNYSDHPPDGFIVSDESGIELGRSFGAISDWAFPRKRECRPATVVGNSVV